MRSNVRTGEVPYVSISLRARAFMKEECRRELQDTKRRINLYRETKSFILCQHTLRNIILGHSPAQALGAAAPGQKLL